MKHCFLLFILFFIYNLTIAQTIVDGYYLTLNNDTLKAQIKVPKKIFSGVDVESLERKIKSNDSNNQSFEKFKPDEINGFGFLYKNENYSFLKKPITTNTYMFFERTFSGNRASVYYYFKNAYRAINKIVVVENKNGEDLVLKNSMSRRRIRNKLINFFSDNPAVEQIVKTKPISINHLENSVKEIVETINNS